MSFRKFKHFYKITVTQKLYIAIVLCSILFLVIWVLGVSYGSKYVSSEYGYKCYLKGEAHGNIEYPAYFETMEDCKEYINNK